MRWNRLSALACLLAIAACAAPAASVAPRPSSTPADAVAPTHSPAVTAATAVPSVLPSAVTLMTHDSFAATQSVIDDFQRQTRVTLSVLKGGDAGTMVNQAILTKDDPLGDVLYGVDNTFLSRALDAGIFVPYLSPSSSSVPAELKTDPQNRVTPIDYGDVCINYDRQAFGVGTPPPARIEDLTRAEYKSKLVVENPATSSPGLAFVLATIVRFGETGDYTWLDYWRDLRANDLLVVSDWNDAYYNQFSGGAGAGDRPLVVSYATSPAAEIYFAEEPLDVGDGPTANLDDGCFRQIEFAGVLAGASNSVGAQQWIDFMASPEFQSDMPLNMFVFPVNPAAAVPDLWLQVPSKATQPLTMDLAQIAANRDRWIGEWTDVVIH